MNDMTDIPDSVAALALEAAATYWNDGMLIEACPTCKGTGMVPFGDSQDLCEGCGGGTILHNGTEIGAMRAALSAVAPMLRGEWRPIESAPEDDLTIDESVLLYDERDGHMTIDFSGRSYWKRMGYTHWQPITRPHRPRPARRSET